jgi:hypothetical protein
MRRKLSSVDIKPLKIHELLAMQTMWTDDLWDQSLEYLLKKVGTTEAIWMARFILDDNLPESIYKIEYLREFRAYPPSVVLAAFDLVRRMPEW